MAAKEEYDTAQSHRNCQINRLEYDDADLL